jgi:nucleotide-binding universal stress UspA family protein
MYKTIVVHVDDSPQLQPRVAVAARLATLHDGHLVGSAVTGISRRDYLLLDTSPMATLPDPDFERLRDRAAEQLRRFTTLMERQGLASWEQRIVEDDAERALLLESRYADLLVLSRGSPARSRLRLSTDLPEYVALHCSRPVLVVPDDHPNDCVGNTVVVGWNASMEATRAIAGALPLLKGAGSVLLALINHEEMSERHGEQPGADVATYLARHGVRVEVVRERSDAGAAPALLGLAHDAGADLVVAGAYGHSRYREWIAGGVTRGLLEKMTVPLLMAH